MLSLDMYKRWELAEDAPKATNMTRQARIPRNEGGGGRRRTLSRGREIEEGAIEQYGRGAIR